MKHHILIALALLVAMCGCRRTAANTDQGTPLTNKYARGFEISELPDGVRLLDIHDPEGVQTETFHYALVPRGEEANIPDGYTRIDIPVRSVVCMTSLQLSNFIHLGLQDLVTGITSTRHLKDSVMNARLRSGATSKIGIEGNFDREVIMALTPDVILVSPFKRGGFEALRDAGAPTVPHLGYKELTPLGQAEWMKVVGLLTGHEREAADAFDSIAARYNTLKARVDSVAQGDRRPTVFSGEMRGGNWYAVGGRSFLAELMRDAGADYFLKDNTESGGVTLDYETVFAAASDADYWRIVNSYDGEYTYDVLRASDARYADFKAWKDGGVIYCNMKERPFYESMPVEPDKILADFVLVFHPQLVPGHEPAYYKLLEK
ncbi:MAG: ABC transporter substrate-binding protein [Muribaculaceae bacterium]|nr:ABC transporter substrate-binding protein [Muribaculaceae bacterium]